MSQNEAERENTGKVVAVGHDHHAGYMRDPAQ